MVIGVSVMVLIAGIVIQLLTGGGSSPFAFITWLGAISVFIGICWFVGALVVEDL